MTQSNDLIVISAPSGAGKTTICNSLVQRNKDFRISVSATTRPPRPNETNGIDYVFLSEVEFFARVKNNEFLEYESVHGYYYGTLKSQVDKLLNQGFHVIFDIDVNGALSMKKKFPNAILIFLKPPSLQELKKRLAERKSDNEVEIQKRLKRLPEEYKKSKRFDYEVINDDLNRTIEEIESIIRKSEKKTSHVSH